MKPVYTWRPVIRIADRADAALIADLSRRTFYDSFASFNTKANMDKFMSTHFTREQLMVQVGRPEHIFLLAYSAAEPLGYTCLTMSGQPPELSSVRAMEISRIYVLETAAGKGVGKALMGRSIDIAREKNMEAIWLGVWEHNQRAIDFYFKSGFEKFGQHLFMLGDDAQTDWLMKKML